MQKIPWNKLISLAVILFVILALGVAGYLSLSRRLNSNSPRPTSSENKFAARPVETALLPCAKPSDELCLLSLGTDGEGNLLVTLRTTLSPLPALYATIVAEEQKAIFRCQPVEISPKIIYCLGPFSYAPMAQVGIYTEEDGTLLAVGDVPLADVIPLPAPTAAPPASTETPTAAPVDQSAFGAEPTVTPLGLSVFGAEPTATPIPSYPGASYPSYPTYP